MSGYVWYSFGSDKTGPALGKALGFDAGKKTPPFANYDVVLGWGCRPGKRYDSEVLAQAIAQNQVRVLNHPDAVQANRDKLATLARLRERGVATPGFTEFDTKRPKAAVDYTIAHALEQGLIAFPLVLLTRYNRGEPLFCYTLEDLQVALKSNAKAEHPYCYARTYDHGEEYRIHILRNTAFLAQKKVMAEDPIAAAVLGMKDKIQRRYRKEAANLFPLHSDTLSFALRQVAAELASSASQLKKSVQLGWEFKDWNMSRVPAEAAELAIEALDAAKLDLGAVSISHVDGFPRVLSMTTAPQLTEEHMAMYVAEIQTFAKAGSKTEAIQNKKETKKETKKEKRASPELVSRLYRMLQGTSTEKAEGVLKSLKE